MSSISGITQYKLLRNKKIRHIKYDGEWYFSVYDLNLQYIGAFKETVGFVISKYDVNNEIEHINCIPFSKVKEVADILENIPEFNQAISALFGFGRDKNK